MKMTIGTTTTTQDEATHKLQGGVQLKTMMDIFQSVQTTGDTYLTVSGKPNGDTITAPTERVTCRGTFTCCSRGEPSKRLSSTKKFESKDRAISLLANSRNCNAPNVLSRSTSRGRHVLQPRKHYTATSSGMVAARQKEVSFTKPCLAGASETSTKGKAPLTTSGQVALETCHPASADHNSGSTITSLDFKTQNEARKPTSRRARS